MSNQNLLAKIGFIVSIQCFIGLLVAVIFLFIQGSNYAFSAVLGTTIVVQGNLLFAYIFFRYYNKRHINNLKKIVIDLYLCEFCKILSTSALLFIVYQYLNISLFPLIIDYIFIYITYWPVLFLINASVGNLI